MAPEVLPQTSQQSTISPLLWGVATGLVAAVIVMLAAAGWINLHGYPERAQRLTIPLSDIDVVAGDAEETDVGIRLTPNERGVTIVLFDGAPRFPAFQFSEITLELTKGAAVRDGQVLWASRAAPEETRRLPLQRNGAALQANLAESPNWADRINGIGVAFMTAGPIELKSAGLRPPDLSFGYGLTRIWYEWTYREGYHGYTINGLKGAGPATLIPIGLAGGLALLVAGAFCFLLTAKNDWQARRSTMLVTTIGTLWVIMTIPWLEEVWAEALWSIETYAGKTETERRLIGSDGHLYDLAARISAEIPDPPQRIIIVSIGRNQPHSTNFERTKTHYYLAPHNVLSRFRDLPDPSTQSLKNGDYILVLSPDHPSYRITNDRIHPGYKVDFVLEYQGARLFKVIGRE